MLTQDTKRKIDSARDILVGKVPDPKAQVEQITTALIYKFMDDMDKASQELGGKARFFTNGYEKYSWTKLMDPKLGGHDRMDLYVETLAKLSLNPNIPQLFRDIFKDAFLPYRSPDTLSLFLKEINGFTYEHSEDLGDSFEYLLSVLGSQGDAGQFRTPRHIIDFIVEAIDPKKTDTICDPACGTAGFLISAYKHILKQHDGKDDPENKEKPLTPDERKNLMDHFTGYDISPDMVRLSRVNLYLHGFPNPTIYEYDTLSSEEKWDESFDVMLANPPFMTPRGGIHPHKRFSVQANRSEVLFVDYILEHLRQNGRAGIIVPEGIIFQSANAYKALRKLLVEDGLLAVVSLPSGVFNPYAGVKTCILLFDKALAKKTQHVLFIKISNDGFDLGAQRRRIEKNDLSTALVVIKEYKKAIEADQDYAMVPQMSFLLDDEQQEANRIATIVTKEKIAENGDYNLSGDRYKETVLRVNQKWPMVKLEEVCDIKSGGTPSTRIREYYEPDEVPWLKSEVCKDSIINKPSTYISKEGLEHSSAKMIPANTAIVALVGATIGKTGFVTFDFSMNQNIAALISKDNKKLDSKFMFYASKMLYDKFIGDNNKFKMANLSFVKGLKIPLPPIEVQKEIVEQIDGYQKIIDGAIQMADNYKPTIKIGSEWQIVELGNLFSETKLGLVKDKSKQSDNYPYPYIKMDNISLEGFLDLSKVVHVEATTDELERYTLNDNDFIYNTRNAPNLVGKSAVFHGENGKYLFNNNILRIRFKKEADPDFVNFYLNTIEGKNKIKTLVSGTTSVAAIYQKNFATIAIPLPSIEIQKSIVAEIGKERKSILSALDSVKIFQDKILKLIGDLL